MKAPGNGRAEVGNGSTGQIGQNERRKDERAQHRWLRLSFKGTGRDGNISQEERIEGYLLWR